MHAFCIVDFKIDIEIILAVPQFKFVRYCEFIEIKAREFVKIVKKFLKYLNFESGDFGDLYTGAVLYLF